MFFFFLLDNSTTQIERGPLEIHSGNKQRFAIADELFGRRDMGVDLCGRTFRVIPPEMWGVENNLSIANTDFAEFADTTDPDGVFRGFPES